MSHPLSSLFQPLADQVTDDQDDDDLVQRLRGPQGPALMRQMQQRLDELQSDLMLRLGRGADGGTYERLQAALQAVRAARDILSRLPVTFRDIPDHPLATRPIQP